MEIKVDKLLVDVEYFDLKKAKTCERKYEVLDGSSETEQAGYISPQRQIENMILAGRRLDQFRKDQFDFESEDEIDEELSDPTRSGNFDMADATQAQIAVKNSLAESAKKASQTAPNASQGVSGASAGGSEPPPENGA